MSVFTLSHMISSDIATAYWEDGDYLAAKLCSLSTHFLCSSFIDLTGRQSEDTSLLLLLLTFTSPFDLILGQGYVSPLVGCCTSLFTFSDFCILGRL